MLKKKCPQTTVPLDTSVPLRNEDKTQEGNEQGCTEDSVNIVTH